MRYGWTVPLLLVAGTSGVCMVVAVMLVVAAGLVGFVWGALANAVWLSTLVMVAALVTVAVVAVGWSARSRYEELLADRYGAETLRRLGFDPVEVATRALSRPWVSQQRVHGPGYLTARHPAAAERIRAIERWAETLTG